ncbi:MAG TPA: DUF1697 domain-containing protein [Bacteroidales bacterium]
METYVAMLRGINVGGQKKIKMEELKAHLEAIHLKKVRTYIQSGNIIFEAEKDNPVDLAKKISDKILKEYGFEVYVLAKNAQELNHVLNNNAFVLEKHKDIDLLYVTFLSETPQQALLEKINRIESNGEEYIVSGSIIYLCFPNGYGQAKLTNNFFESKLKLMATTRNWKTVMKLAEMAVS